MDDLREHLRFAVPIRITEIQRLQLTDDHLTARQSTAARVVAHQGDTLMFTTRNQRKGRSATVETLAALVDAVAMAAIREPSGVEVFGDHYQATPARRGPLGTTSGLVTS